MEMDFKHLHVVFYMDSVQNKRLSEEEGRPIYEDMEMVKIQAAGDPKSTFTGLAHGASSVRDPHTNRRVTYAELHEGPYAAFKKGIDFKGTGTPLSELPFIGVSKAKELAALEIHTAEALAGLDGANLNRLGMGGRDLKNKAQAWLDGASGANDFSKIAGENDALKKQMEALQAQMAALSGTPAKEQEPPKNTADSQFAAWADEDIGNWIADMGGERPHHKCSHETVVAKADALNAKLAKQKEAA